MIQGKLIIAGPCSAESEEQLFDTVSGLVSLGCVDLIRCGVWKPRSRPGGFEGKGDEALEWIAEVKRECPGIRFMIEVAEPTHVERAQKKDIDAMWIGARTVCNPFMVQQIADAMKGLDVDVFVKNPMAPDVLLWEGAIERVQRADVRRVTAVHRGFVTCFGGRLRNEPLWLLPMQLRRLLPDVPLICDPSHIAGRRELVGGIAEESMALGFDGLMIESHAHPDQAMTDSRQQLTPRQLGEVLNAVCHSYGMVKPRDLILGELNEMQYNLQELIASFAAGKTEE